MPRAPRLDSLAKANVVMLDCGKRGGGEILEGLATAFRARGASTGIEQKTSAHRMASRRLIESLAERADAVVYGVID